MTRSWLILIGTLSALALALPAGAQAADFSFAPGSPLTAGGGGGDVAAGDFDGDGIDDLAVGSITGSPLGVLIRIAGEDGAWSEGATLLEGKPVGLLVAENFDGDEHLDLLAVESRPNQPGTDDRLWLLAGNGDGTFGAPEELVVDSPDPYKVTYAEAADMSGDLVPDLLIGNAPDQLVVGQNDGHGEFTLVGPQTLPSEVLGPVLSPSGTSGDFNGDGQADLIVAISGQSDPVANHGFTGVLSNSGGAGTFTLPPADEVGFTPRIVSAELTGDQFDDLLAVQGEAGDMAIHVWPGSAEGLIDDPVTITEPGTDITLVEPRDFDGDGDPDLAWVESDGDTPPVSNHLRWASGDGSGGFTIQGAATDVNFDANLDAVNFAAAGRFDPDDVPDIAVSFEGGSGCADPCGVSILQNQMGPEFAIDPPTLDLGDVPYRGTASGTFRIESTGTAALSTHEVDLTGPHADQFDIAGSPVCDDGSNPASVEPGAGCDVPVEFTPAYGPTSGRTAAVAIQTNAGTAHAQLSGEGLEGGLSFAENPVDFGRVRAGTSATRTIEIASEGPDPLFILGTTNLNPESGFRVKGDDCTSVDLLGPTFPAGTTCRIEVTIDATGAGIRTGSFELATNSSLGNETVDVRANVFSPAPRPTYRATLKAGKPRALKRRAVWSGRIPVTVRNRGTGNLAGLTLAYRATQGRAKSAGRVKLGRVSPGRTAKRTLRIAFAKRKFKPGKPVRVKLRLMRGGKTLARAAKTLRLPR